jgi:predicted nucleic acid-binding protein
MDLFWDSSALLAIVFTEGRNPEARKAWDSAEYAYAWRWLKVEASSALARRGATPSQWAHLEELMSVFRFLDIPGSEFEEVCSSNRKWRLTAADAGHVFCFQQASFVLPHLQFICFDDEMLTVSRKEGFLLWRPPEDGAAAPAIVREPRPSYGRKSKRPARV